MRMRGNRPSLIACSVSENAPEIMACEAMTVANVANRTSGTCAQAGASWKNGLSMAAGSASSRPPWPR